MPIIDREFGPDENNAEIAKLAAKGGLAAIEGGKVPPVMPCFTVHRWRFGIWGVMTLFRMQFRWYVKFYSAAKPPHVSEERNEWIICKHLLLKLIEWNNFFITFETNIFLQFRLDHVKIHKLAYVTQIQTYNSNGDFWMVVPVICSWQSMKKLTVGGVLQMSSSHPWAEPDIKAWCRTSGHKLLQIVIENEERHFFVRCAN